jgi:DNA transformation protein
MTTPAPKIRNIGPKSMAWLRQTGVRTLEELQAVGSLAAFVRIKRAGFKPSLNLLYALEGAVLGCHWQEIPEERRTALVQSAEAEVALLPQPKYKRMPAASPVTHTQMDGDGGDTSSGDGGAASGFDEPDRGDDGAEHGGEAGDGGGDGGSGD